MQSAVLRMRSRFFASACLAFSGVLTMTLYRAMMCSFSIPNRSKLFLSGYVSDFGMRADFAEDWLGTEPQSLVAHRRACKRNLCKTILNQLKQRIYYFYRKQWFRYLPNLYPYCSSYQTKGVHYHFLL